MSEFKFSLNQRVRISCSSEGGNVIGRVEYVFSESRYLVRYQAADGSALEAWWGESALEVYQIHGGSTGV